jgi:hypothetical protein
LASLDAVIAREESAFMERKERLDVTISDPDRLREEVGREYDRVRLSLGPVRAQREAVIANLVWLASAKPLVMVVSADSVSL